MLRYAIFDLWRRGSRLVLTLSGIVVAISGLVAVSGLADGLRQAWLSGLDEADSHLLVHEGAALDVFNGSLPLAPLPALRALPGVRTVDPIATKLVALGPQGRHALVVGLESGSQRWQSLEVISGRAARPGDRWVAVLGEQIARNIGAEVGGTIEILFQSFRVIGIARHGRALNDNAAFVPLQDIAALTYSPDRVTFFALRLDAPDDPQALRTVRDKVARLVPDSIVEPAADMVADNQILALFDALSWSVSAVAVGLGAFLVAGTLMILVADRRRELAVLLCVGWSAPRVFALVVLQGLALSAVGAALGLGVGLATVTLVAAHPLASGLLEPGLDGVRIGTALGGSIAMGLAGAWLPALQASLIDPAEVLSWA